MLEIAPRCFILNREFLKKRLCLWTRQTCRFHLSTIANEDVQEKANLTPQERFKMKQKKKEATRQERIDNQLKKLLKKQAEMQSLSQEQLNNDDTLPDTYNPAYLESKWYDHWMNQGIFNADSSLYQSRNRSNNFTMCLPPPNITGNLHLGHALGCSLQDAICRWRRMKGESVTWVPGCDHAGIATQVIVEKKLKKEKGVSRHDLGRERFLEEVAIWKEQYGGEILEQMKKLGCSLDWSRTTFTLDPKLSKAVREAFIRLFDEGLIYRSKRLVNWSCALKSAISDIEVDSMELLGPKKLKVPGYDNDVQFGIIHTFAYPLSDSAEKLMVSTTRLETMLGDVGVAVHPNDSRYSHLIGRNVLHPFTNKPLPIVADNDVSPDFGTGAVKLTPGHDATDFDIAIRHKLNLINIMDESGHLVNVPPEFMNIPRFTARQLVEKKLDSLGLLVGVANHPMSLPICSRSGDVVEYIIKDQWFVDCQQMAGSACEAVESGRLEFIPGHYEKRWKEWLSNTRDWCISRQLWWGHRIPAYKISTLDNNPHEIKKDEWVAAHSEDEAIAKASHILKKPVDQIRVYQDEDVLDTWFSSSLIPFSVFGWPDENSDLTKLYPTDLLETASDIMFFWVARMVMMGEKLTGQLPFKKVHFHSIVQDAKGRKMSKSLGNVIDPMHVIKGISLDELHASLDNSNLSAEEVKKAKPILSRDFPLGIPECGADALRFALCSYNYHNHFVNMDVNYMKFCKTFCNKIWQSYRFIASKVKQDLGRFEPQDIGQLPDALTPMDRWVLSRLSSVVLTTNEAFDSLKLFEATKALQKFWWSEFCSVYLECVKPSLLEPSTNNDTPSSSSSTMASKSTLTFCLQNFLKLLHPIMPFLSEHLHQELLKIVTNGDPDSNCSISLAAYPSIEEFQKFENKQVENEMERILEISSKINSSKSLFKFDKYTQIPVFLKPTTIDPASISTYIEALKTLTKNSTINLLSATDPTPVGCIDLGDVEGCAVYLQLKDVIDVKDKLDELIKTRNKHEKELNNLINHPALTDLMHDHHLVIKEKMTTTRTTLDKVINTIQSLEQI